MDVVALQQFQNNLEEYKRQPGQVDQNSIG